MGGVNQVPVNVTAGLILQFMRSICDRIGFIRSENRTAKPAFHCRTGFLYRTSCSKYVTYKQYGGTSEYHRYGNRPYLRGFLVGIMHSDGKPTCAAKHTAKAEPSRKASAYSANEEPTIYEPCGCQLCGQGYADESGI